MTTTPDLIASLVQQQYDALPAKRKPAVRDNGIHEWVPLSGIVAQGRDGKLQCIALATGMKCLPSSKLPQAQGNVLHDWHAEVLVIRAFNRFVLDECKALAQGGGGGGVDSSEFLRWRSADEVGRESASEPTSETGTGGMVGGGGGAGAGGGWHGQPFAWREDVRLHMYCSEAPCGDASMELTMASQDDATPWDIPPPPPPSLGTTTATTTDPTDPDQTPSALTPSTTTTTLPGRAYFSHLGIVRRKPSRPDAPPTLSKSCSDKLALKQCTSLLSSATSLLVSPAGAYVRTLVLPETRHSAPGCERAFSAAGRLAGVVVAGRRWGGRYGFAPFAVRTTGAEFWFSRSAVAARTDKTAASNLAVAWTGGRSGLEEATLGGVLQGRKQFDVKGASFASRRRVWAVAVEIAGLLGEGLVDIQRALDAKTYNQVKDTSLLEARRRVKEEVENEALKGWVKNSGDEAFTLYTADRLPRLGPRGSC